MTNQIKHGFDELFENASNEMGYFSERATYDITEQIFKRMEELGLSKSDLAQRLDTGKPYVTKILRGNTNFTLQSLEKIARALDFEGGFEVRLMDKPGTPQNPHFGSEEKTKSENQSKRSKKLNALRQRESVKA